MQLPAPYDNDEPVREVRVADAPAVPTAVVTAHEFPAYKIPALTEITFAHLPEALKDAGITPIGVPFSMQHRFAVDTADIEVGLPVAQPLPAPLELPNGWTVSASELPAGRVAIVSHLGSRAEIPEAWAALMQRCGDKGEQMRFPSWQFYVDTPAAQDDTGRLRTDLVGLLEPHDA